jgi:hypothetical protein
MRKLLGFNILAVLACAIPAVQAGSITYSATVGCDNTCVTAFVEWQNFNPGVAFVLVEDNFGDPLFTLSTDFPPETTGEIDPDPQTIVGLTASQIGLIEAGGSQLLGQGLQQDAVQPLSELPSFANLVLEDQSSDVLGETVFTTNTPEPATWMLTAFSLGLLFAFVLVRRRKLATAPATK